MPITSDMQLMLPVPMMDSYSLYVVDVEERTLLVMDPCETSEPMSEVQYKHEDNANFILARLRRCIHENIPGWYIPAQGWTINYNVNMHESCEMYGQNAITLNVDIYLLSTFNSLIDLM